MLKVILNFESVIKFINSQKKIIGKSIINTYKFQLRFIFDNYLISPRLVIYSESNFIKGITYQDILKKRNINKILFILILYQGLIVLNYLNYNNIFHNDIKTDNFMIVFTNENINLLNREIIINNTDLKLTYLNKKFNLIRFILIDLEYSTFETNFKYMFPYDCFCFLDLFVKNSLFKKTLPIYL